MNTKLPTTKEIARRLNVSVSTVSRALNDRPRIGIATKEKIKQLAKELNYEPNTQAILFKQNKTKVIGVVLPFIREEFFSQAISGIETAALEHDYTILFGQSYDDAEKEKKVVAAMRKQRVDGLIISLSKETNNYDHLAVLENYNIPVIYFDRVPAIQNANKVFCNLYKGTIKLIEWLLNKGYKQIALINGPDKLTASKERLQGYKDCMTAKKIKLDMRLIEQTDLTKEGTQRAMEKLMSLKNPPTAIISFNDYVHMDAVQYAQKQHIRVNIDIAFVSYANLPITAYTAFPPLVSVEQYPYRQGEKAMQCMIEIRNKKSVPDNAPHGFLHEEMDATLSIH